jgi:hypothetical protein
MSDYDATAAGLDSTSADPANAPWHYLDHPHEGQLRVWSDLQNFIDWDEQEVAAIYVDNNVAGFSIEVYESSNIDDHEIYLWYNGGHEYRPKLGDIGLYTNPCSKLLQMSNGLIGPASRDLYPMLNSLTTPRLAWLRQTLHDESDHLTGNQDALDAHFGKLTYQLGQHEATGPDKIRQGAIFIDSPAY